MSRVQLALNVTDVRAATAFYSKLFGAQPAKVRPGYANFVIAEPPLKLVLIEDAAQKPGSLNHLGVEMETTEQVAAATARLTAAGLATTAQDKVTCCYAVQDKVWVDGPGGEPWELYTVVADAEMSSGRPGPDELAGAACCTTRPGPAVAGAPSACCSPSHTARAGA